MLRNMNAVEWNPGHDTQATVPAWTDRTSKWGNSSGTLSSDVTLQANGQCTIRCLVTVGEDLEGIHFWSVWW